MSPSKADRRIDAILTGAKQILDTSKDLLCLCPIPGLPGAASVLSTLIDMILKVRGNEETRKDLAKKIAELASIIERTMKQASYVPETGDRTPHRLVTSPELEKRISTLKSDLEDLTNKAEELQEGSFLGFLLSKSNADTLSNIRTGIEDATRKFSIEGEITIELLINGIVNAQMRDGDERALEKLTPVNAGYTSGLNPTTSGTLEGTRTALLEELTEWTLRPESNQDGSFIYVISGGAGTGKSTIAYEMCQRLKKEGALGASFFFVNGAEKLNTTTHVIRTIAYQLARNQTGLYPHITAAAREYTGRGKQGEQLQVDLEDLIIKPLTNVHSSHHPIILVLDALDECTIAGQDEIVRLLYLLMQQLPKIPFPVRVLITSRPEMHIQNALDDDNIRRVSKPLKLHEIQRMIVDADIKLFLEARLKDLKCYEDVCNARPSVIEDLTKLSAGLFIYADTVVKFLRNTPDLAVTILDALLSNNASGAAFSLKNLDRLYMTVLQNALNDDDFSIPHMKNSIQVVLGSLALLQDHVSIPSLDDMVNVPVGFIRHILGRLGSVILKPETDNVEIRLLHASFPQFLADAERCTDRRFYVDPLIHHRRLALTCLEVMTEKYPLKTNICRLDDPTRMKSDNPDLHDVSQWIPQSLQYSCAHWATHLSQCNGQDWDILNAVKVFVRTKLLVWVEVLSYMGRLEVAVPALLAALSWCEVYMQDEDKFEVIQFINDTHRIVLQCYIPINECPEHLYISASLLAPSCVSIAQHNHSNNNHPTIRATTPRDSVWGACLHTIPIDSYNCRAMLSPDGSSIASGSGSWNGKVCIWDASIGLSKRTLTGHTKGVLCVAWSPNGEFLASGSADGTIRVWNATSGAQVHVQDVQSRKCEVYAIAWSRDGRQLVTGAEPGGVEVWDIVVGKELKGRTAVPEVRVSKAISKDARRVVDRAVRRKLRIWDIECDGGRILKELPVQFLVYSAVFLHNDTQVAFSGQDKAIYVWDLESGACTPKIELKSKIAWEGKTTVYGIALSQRENILASSTGDRIHLFDTKSWSLLGSFQGNFHLSASFSPDDRRLLTSLNTIEMLDLTPVLASKSQIIPPTTNVIHDIAINFVTISPDGERVAAVSRGAVSIWSLKSGLLFRTIQGYFTGGITFSPDARKIAVGEFSKISIWDIMATPPTLIRSIPTANNVSDKISWSSDGHCIAGAAHGPNSTRGLGVFDALTGELTKFLTLNNQDKLWSVEFSHDCIMLYVQSGTIETIFKWKEGEQVNMKQHRWETELQRREKFREDAWIIREHDRKRICWIQQPYPVRLARWGDYYVVGQESGRLDIFHIEESSVLVDASKSS